MKNLKKLLVKDLYEGLKKQLDFELVAGSGGLLNTIESHRVQKPGLALAGFLKHLHTERVQIFGETELDYLSELPEEVAVKRINDFFSQGVSCVVVTKGLSIPPYIAEAAQKYETPLLRTPKVSSYSIEIISSFLEDMLAPEVSVHGVLMDVFGVGVLIIGKSGIGKSECALDLISKGHRLVADDLVIIKKKKDILWGTSPRLIHNFIEARGLGIVNIKDLFGVSSIRDKKRVDLVVNLIRLEEEKFERISFGGKVFELLDVKIPMIEIPVTPGRNITLLVELAAKIHLLRLRGVEDSIQERLMFEAEERGEDVE